MELSKNQIQKEREKKEDIAIGNIETILSNLGLGLYNVNLTQVSLLPPTELQYS